MKKEEAVERIERAGLTIHDVNARIWNVALNPTQFGWTQSLASVLAIPVLSAASVGHLVSEAVVNQISPGVFDHLSNLGQSKKDDDENTG